MMKKSAAIVLFIWIILAGSCFAQDIDATITAIQNMRGYSSSGSSRALNVGDTFIFGEYEQDNNLNNGKEPIEWLVLAVENSRALLISKYAIDSKPYNDEWSDVTWEKCYLRKWMNGDFYNAAFNSEEKGRIFEVTNSSHGSSVSGINGGNSTKDRMFVLSIDEANRYFSNDGARKFAATAYAKANRSSYTYHGNGYPVVYYKYDDHGKSWCWLRTPGMVGFLAAGVDVTGKINNAGENVYEESAFVRPAFWIKL